MPAYLTWPSGGREGNSCEIAKSLVVNMFATSFVLRIGGCPQGIHRLVLVKTRHVSNEKDSIGSVLEKWRGEHMLQ